MARAAEHVGMTSTAAVTLRLATAADAPTVADLAALDAARLRDGAHLIAERDGTAVAALALADGAVYADPFQPSADLVAMLRTHAGSRPRPRRSLRRRRRVTRPALA
jgi:hypothetical protein